MIYQVARYLASLAPVTYGHVDAVILTGAMSQSKYVTEGLIKRLEYLAPVFVYPGEDELTALAHNVYRALNNLPYKKSILIFFFDELSPF